MVLNAELINSDRTGVYACADLSRQEVKGLKKNCLGGRPVSMQNVRLIVQIVYLFLHGCGLHYNVLSGLSVKQEIKGLTT